MTRFIPTSILAPALALGLAGLSATSLGAQASHAHDAGHGANAQGAVAHGAAVPLLDGLGRWHRPVGTSNAMAQRYFDQGLRLYYAFNHAESVRAFREAQRLDPGCAMCAWGEALALGPNINAPMDPAAERQAIVAAKRAVALLETARSATHTNHAKGSRVLHREQDLVHAVAARYFGDASSTRASRDSAYATAMAVIADASPEDADVLALAAEAAMTLSPWNYWAKDGTAGPGTSRLLGWLERGLRLAPDHPGVCHFYIHAVEAAQPERAVSCAERLASLMPGAGHIVHMPAHIYIRVGRWADAIDINKHAVHADNQYFDGPHTPESAFYSAAYQSHNHHFLALAAVRAGSSATALASSRNVVRIVTPEIARAVPPLEPMLAIPVQTLVTFGKWEEILRTPLPPSALRVALSHFWYARGIAFAATGRMAEARATVDSIRAVAKTMPDGEPRMTLDIAALLVEGEIALRGGSPVAAVALFGAATDIEDRLAYMEPPTWYYPVRHSLGKAQLAAGKPKDAEATYRADLKRFPENGWSLKGLSLSLVAQGRAREAAEAHKRFVKAWRLADVKIDASRF